VPMIPPWLYPAEGLLEPDHWLHSAIVIPERLI
jgi:hypothetical protein